MTKVVNLESFIEKGHNLLASCVKNAANEVRWLTTNRRPNTLDNLPSPDKHDFWSLFEEIDSNRNEDSTPDVIKTSLSKYHTIFSNAYFEKPGKRKRRTTVERSENKGQLEELSVDSTDDEVTVTEIRPTLEKSNNIAQWQREENISSPPDAAKYIVAINEQTTNNNQLNAILSHRFADQLKVRQQCAPCDYQGLTTYEVQQFIEHCIKQTDSATAQALICSIAFGKTTKQLDILLADATANEHIRLTKGYFVYQIFHKLPSSTLSADKAFLLHDVEHHFAIECPRFGSTGPNISSDTVFRAFISQFNKSKGTRVTLGRIARYKKQWLTQQGNDETIIALLHNSAVSANSGLSYSRFNIAELQSVHEVFINHLLQQTPQAQLTLADNRAIGTRLAINDSMLSAGLKLLSGNIINLSKISIYHPLLHTEYTSYIQYLLALATGYRPVNGIFGTIDDFDLVTGTIWISDKESRQGLAARILYLPKQAIHQIEYYLNYLETLLNRYRYENPTLAQRCQQALSGEDSLLFGRYSNDQDYQTTVDLCQNEIHKAFVVKQAQDYVTEVIEISPKYISEQTDRILPLPNNWNRHYMRNKLIEYGVSPPLVDAWMGHEPIGAEGFGRYSGFSVADLKAIATTIEAVFDRLEICAINVIGDR